MKFQHLIPILFLAAFCTVSAQTNNAPTLGQSSGSIVGTWHLIRSDNRAVDSPLLWRFYTNGTWAEWPLDGLRGTYVSNGVARAGYRLDGNKLIIAPGSDVDQSDTNLTVEIRGDIMTTVAPAPKGGVVQIDFHRLVPDMEPGSKMPEDHSTSGQNKGH